MEPMMFLNYVDISVFEKIYNDVKNSPPDQYAQLREQLPVNRFYYNPPLGWHHTKAEVERRVYVDGQMPYLVLDTGSVCRYKCEMCYTYSNESNRKGKYPSPLSLEQKKHILSVAKERLGTETFIIEGAGEPVLNTDTIPMLEHAIKLGLRAIVFNSGIKIEKLLPLIIESGGSVGFKFHGLEPHMTPDIYNRILGQPDAWDYMLQAIDIIFHDKKLNTPVFDKDGKLLAMTRVVLDNYMNPEGKAAYLSTLYWAYQNNCAIALTGDMPTKKDLKSLDYMSAEEFTSTVLQARYFLWVMGWMPPGRAHLVSECEQKYGLRITDGMVGPDGKVAGNVFGCVGEVEPFMDLRFMYGEELTKGLETAWARRRQWVPNGCQPRFNALSSLGMNPDAAGCLFTDPVRVQQPRTDTPFETSLLEFLASYAPGKVEYTEVPRPLTTIRRNAQATTPTTSV
ncbi:hypothetical protein AMR41_08145 [Hapalosiphon sp. MRB220]|nr:hypothetical protein AMR41_08145 [Hapalosiphon sp. MRB220]